MIWNYGLHWHVDRVWGPQYDSRTLYGALSRSAGEDDVVDFSGQKGIYALYADYDLVYIGKTGAGVAGLLSRLRSHRMGRLSERWNRFSWFGTIWVNDNNELEDSRKISDYTNFGWNADIQDFRNSFLNILEGVSIAVSEPRLNLQQGNFGKEEIPQYYQWWEGEE